MNLLPEVHTQEAWVRVDTHDSSFAGWTELWVTPAAGVGAATAAAVGLHCFGLRVAGVSVDGEPAEYQLLQSVSEGLPESVVAAKYETPERMAAAVAEAAYYQYERALQREREPELLVQLPDAAQRRLEADAAAEAVAAANAAVAASARAAAAATAAAAAAAGQSSEAAVAPDAAQPPAAAEGEEGGAQAMEVDGALPLGTHQATADHTAAGAAGGGEMPAPAEPAATSGRLRVRVEFASGPGTCGWRFWGGYACTDAQVRRTSAWLPCVDTPKGATRFTLRLTCRAEQTAVGPGRLLRQTWADAQRQWRTFHYEVPLSVAPCHIGAAVGTFQVLAAPHSQPGASSSARGGEGRGGGAGPGDHHPAATALTCFAPLPAKGGAGGDLDWSPITTLLSASSDDAGGDGSGGSGVSGSALPILTSGSTILSGPLGGGSSSRVAGQGPSLAHTAQFVSLVAGHYERLLGAALPLPALQLVFLPPELLLEGEGQAAAGLHLLSAAHLIDPRALEQSVEARSALAQALARQWFGVALRPAGPSDGWLAEGLTGWLEGQYVRRYLGKNELAYRRWRERQAIFAADNGDVPPLAYRGMGSPSPWGPLYGTEALDPSRLRPLKAVAVVCMLERRAGEDLFRKHVENTVAAALAALSSHLEHPGTSLPHAAAGPAVPAGRAWLLDTMAFLNELGRAGSFKREMAPFAERWVYGRGIPHITAGFIYNRRSSALELAVRQTGSESAKRAADVSARAAEREGTGAGIIKVLLREGEQTSEHPVHLGGEAAVLAEVKVTQEAVKRQPGRRGRRKRDGGVEEQDAAELAAMPPEPDDPLLWVRLDPGGEWLADITLLQPERMLCAQLLHSRDVVAQAVAVQGLARQRVSALRRPGALPVLQRVLETPSFFYRVRCDAAIALASLQDDEGGPAGLPSLLSFYKSRYFDATADLPKSTAFSDPGEYYVAQAVVSAVARCREEGGTPVDALLFLLPCVQDYTAATTAPYSDYGLVAGLCGALGDVQFPGGGDMVLVLLERFLQRDMVLPSAGHAVGAACLEAMASLALGGSCEEEQLQRIAKALAACQAPNIASTLCRAAAAAGLRLLAAQQGVGAAVRSALGAIPSAAPEQPCGSKQQRQQSRLPPSFLLEEFAGLVAEAAAAGAAAAVAAAGGDPEEEVHQQQAAQRQLLAGADLSLLARTAALLGASPADCRTRHLAFVLLQRLGGAPPTLYRPPVLDAGEELSLGATAAPAGTRLTGQLPAPSAHTAATGAAAAGPAAVGPTRIRLHLPGAKSMAVSGGLSGPAASEGRAMSEVQQPSPPQGGPHDMQQGAVYSPVRPAELEDVTSLPAAAAAAEPVAAAHVQPGVLGPEQGTAPLSWQPQQPHQQNQQQQAPVHAPAAAEAAPKIVRLRLAPAGGATGAAVPQQQQQQQQSREPSPLPGGGRKRRSASPGDPAAAAPEQPAAAAGQQPARPPAPFKFKLKLPPS